MRRSDERARHATRNAKEHYAPTALHCQSNKLHLQMALLSIIRSIASSKPDEINERINVRLVRLFVAVERVGA